LKFIQQHTDPNAWNHVNGEDNPSDLPTRESTAEDLTQNHEWIFGPKWLYLPENEWPQSSVELKPFKGELPEQKTIAFVGVLKKEMAPLEKLFSHKNY
jgi:hypothetical protein